MRRGRPSPLEPYRAYVAQRLGDDPHLDATVLLRELRVGAGNSVAPVEVGVVDVGGEALSL